MLFVGGDQMTTEMSVPLARETPVMPGEEVDVAIEMVAPTEHGRYLGYWRLTGPFMKRKFGQKVWCHIQVVDPSQSGAEAVEAFFEDLPSTLAEIARKKADLAAADDAADDAADTAADAAAAEAHLVTAKDINKDKAVEAAATDAAATMEAKVEAPAAAPAPAPAALVSGEADAPPTAADEPSTDGSVSDDGLLVTGGMLGETPVVTTKAEGKLPVAAGGAPGSSVVGVRAALREMGFTDQKMIDAVVAKNGDDVEACARDLAVATEWDSLLDDLEEMGFSNRELNQTLMVKNSGNMKRTVRDLVEA